MQQSNSTITYDDGTYWAPNYNWLNNRYSYYPEDDRYATHVLIYYGNGDSGLVNVRNGYSGDFGNNYALCQYKPTV